MLGKPHVKVEPRILRGVLVILTLLCGLALVHTVQATPARAATTAADCIPGGTTAASLNTANLTKFRNAVSQIGSRPVNVLYTGDSISEGYFASSDANRFQDVLRGYLQKAYNPAGVTGGQGYIPFWHSQPGIPQRWTVGGLDKNNQPPKLTLPGFGLGQRGGVLSDNQYGQITITGDRFQVLYTSGAYVGKLGISIDGGPTNVVVTTSNVTQSGRVWDSGPLTRGSHTIRVSVAPNPGGSTTVVADGLMAFDGDYKGIRTWDNALAGSSAATFAATSNNFWDQANDTVNPDLIVIGLGANDRLYYNAATYANLLTTIIQRYRNGSATSPPAPNASIMLWIEQNQGGYAPSTWQPYVDAAYQVAQAQGTGLVDMYARLGTAAKGSLFADNIHPTDAGHRLIAVGIGQALGVAPCLGSISGKLVNGTGAPVPGVCVFTYTASGIWQPMYFTAADGTYFVPGLTEPSYYVAFWDCTGANRASVYHLNTTDPNKAVTVTPGATGLVDKMT